MLKKTQDLTTKRELAMQVSNIVHWDFDVSTQKFESYNDPINDYAPNRLVTLKEFESVVHPDDRSTYFDAIQSMLSGENETVNFTCRMQTKYDETWQCHRRSFRTGREWKHHTLHRLPAEYLQAPPPERGA